MAPIDRRGGRWYTGRVALPLALPLLLLFLPVKAATAGTTEEEPSSVPGRLIAYTDELGERVSLSARPSRIISATLMTDEILLALVDPGRILAVTHFAIDPDVSCVAVEAKAITLKLDLNVETYIVQRPDLVLVAEWSAADSVRQLRQAGIPVFCLRSPRSLKEIQAKIRLLAGLVGEEERGKRILGWMDERLEAVEEKVSAIPAGERLTVMDYQPWGASFGHGSSWDEVVRLAGLKNAVAGMATDKIGVVPISREKLLELDPDILVLPGWIYGEAQGAARFQQEVVSDPVLRSLRAVGEGRVYTMPERLRSSISQYLVLAVESLARFAYPHRFP